MDSSLEATGFRILEQVLSSSGKRIPRLGFGTEAYPLLPPQVTMRAILQTIELGYRHFKTAATYGTEQPLGEAIKETISLGLIKSRDELFITSKLRCSDAHGELVLHGRYEFSISEGDLLPMDFGSVWAAMEECQRLGLTNSIGGCNFSSKKLADILSIAEIPPAVNQVELNPLWNRKKLREFCNANGIFFVGYSPLGAKGTIWGSNRVLECDVPKEIAKAKGKTAAQIRLRWAYEQGASILVKSYNGERMEQNLDIFNWSLSMEELKRISELPQSKGCDSEKFFHFQKWTFQDN